MTDRTPSAGAKAPNARVTTTTGIATDPLEENVVRMRHGFPVPDSHKLSQVGQDHEATRERLRQIELMAFEQSGRLDELRQEAGIEPADLDDAAKQKIVAGLKEKMSK